MDGQFEIDDQARVVEAARFDLPVPPGVPADAVVHELPCAARARRAPCGAAETALELAVQGVDGLSHMCVHHASMRR
ncbi:hypothetical protein GCM10022221_14780 [Actinocorallia aurea]